MTSQANLQSDDLQARKAETRRSAGAIRRQLHERSTGAGAALAAQDLGFLGAPGGRVVSGFYPYKSEIDVLPLMARLSEQGWRTALPVVVADGLPLEFRLWRPGEETVAGVWNIPIPDETSPATDPDVLLVPMLAFDAHGYRLGYGGGFYDRSLERLRATKKVIAVGVAYRGQQRDHVPHDDLDQPLDWVLTEEGLITPRKDSPECA